MKTAIGIFIGLMFATLALNVFAICLTIQEANVSTKTKNTVKGYSDSDYIEATSLDTKQIRLISIEAKTEEMRKQVQKEASHFTIEQFCNGTAARTLREKGLTISQVNFVEKEKQ